MRLSRACLGKWYRKVPSSVFLALAPVSKACAAKVFGICSLGKSPVLPVCSKKNRSQPPSSSVASSSHLHNPEPVLVNTRVILHEQSRRKNGQPFSGSRFSGSRFFAHLCVTKRPHIEGRSFRGALRREEKTSKRHDTARHGTTRHDTTRPFVCEDFAWYRSWLWGSQPDDLPRQASTGTNRAKNARLRG